MGKFHDHLVEEGFFDAVGEGFTVGFAAFRKRREADKKKTDKKQMEEKVLSAKGDDLEKLIVKIVNNGYSVGKNGKLKASEPKVQKSLDWLRKEHVVSAQGRHFASQNL